MPGRPQDPLDPTVDCSTYVAAPRIEQNSLINVVFRFLGGASAPFPGIWIREMRDAAQSMRVRPLSRKAQTTNEPHLMVHRTEESLVLVVLGCASFADESMFGSVT
jgi:hypothetical protein